LNNTTFCAISEASKATSPTRHGRKLRDKLREINRAVKQLAQDHYRFHKRLVKVEGSQRQLKRTVTNIKQQMVPETKDSTAHEENSSTKLDSRLSGVEHTISEYTLSLQNLGEKVNVLNELQESTSQLFGALEGLETRYDEKLTDMQTSLAKIEASVSAVSNSNEDIKEQQVHSLRLLNSCLLMSMKKHI
jgi:chromosome segregation ATPase